MWLRAALALAPFWASGAYAAEVVWLQPPPPELAELVAKEAAAVGAPLAPQDLRTAATRWSESDAKAYAALAAVLDDVRRFETQFEGELLIMRDLQPVVDAIGVVRNETDRKALYAALAYQGFAVNRYFGTELAADPQGAPYAGALETLVVERPWWDAIALEPDRAVTAYEIAEAPQRIAFEELRARVNARLPASVVLEGLPRGTVLKANGREVAPGPTGAIRLTPGRQLLHAELDGAIVARWDVHLAPGEQRALQAALGDDAWRKVLAAWTSGLPAAPPPGLYPAIEVMGGEVWIARAVDDDAEIQVVRLDAGASEATVQTRTVSPPRETPAVSVSGFASVSGGWQSAGNWFRDDPKPERNNKATVNAAETRVGLGADVDVTLLRVGAGVDLHYAFGAEHATLYGEQKTQLRLYPHVGVGVRYAQVTAGFAFPHHPALGARATIPLVAGLELRGDFLYGFKGSLRRDAEVNGQVVPVDWIRDPLYSAGLGIGYRLRR